MRITPRIKIAIYFIMASLILSIIKNLLYATMTSIQIWVDPLNLVDLTYTAFIGLLGYFIINGKNWARIIYLLTVVLGIFASPVVIIRMFKYPVICVVVVLVFIFQWVALFLLFRKEKIENKFDTV